MKKSILILLLTISTQLFAQESLEIVLSDSSRLKLTSLKIDVKIMGNFATTTYDMKFYNALDRTLEGELAFPLGAGQAVSRFAMEVNDKLREAVIVERELARVAFESTIRQNIDPGLLEKTEGNNYKARIYPILPEKHKQVVLTFEQELSTFDQVQNYVIPLGIDEGLEEFSVNIEIVGRKGLPRIKPNSYKDFFFTQEEGRSRAKLKKRNFVPQYPITVQIPNGKSKDLVANYTNYFYAYQTLNPHSRLKTKPKKITLLWDTSYSMRNRNVNKELELLKDYFEYLQNADIRFIAFSNTVHTNTVLKMKNGNWDSLKKSMENTNYDGGTTMELYNALNFKSDEILLFSDGLANLGDFKKRGKTPIYPINSIVSANHESLNALATQSGGSYINVVQLPHNAAVKALKQEVFQFLGSRHDKSIKEVYPKNKVNVSEDFSITGKFSKETTLELLFGYGNKVTERIKIRIGKNEKTELVKRLWAKEKLVFLNQNKERNREEIIKLAKEYHLITDYTSMLILDRIEDYVRYRIEPPEELKLEYKMLIDDAKEERAYRQDELNAKKIDLLDAYEDILDWYATSYPEKERKLKTENTENTNQVAVNSDQVAVNSENNQNTNTTDTNTITVGNISGNVADENGSPLPGVAIHVKGTTNGTVTDFDGNFTINAHENEELIVSYLGYITINLPLGTATTVSVIMEESDLQLDEIVIVGYGTKKVEQMTSSVTVVAASLAGQVAGIEIPVTEGVADGNAAVTVRGVSTINTNNAPLYILDGEIVSGNPMQEIKPDAIKEIQVLKALNASTIYGARAANGVIIVTTKEGFESNHDAITALNQKIAERIALKSWNPDTPYLKVLEKETSIALAYAKYLEIRDAYSNSPSFYLDVSDFFDRKGDFDIALRVLTNLAEIELNNHEIMKALAYKLEYFNKEAMAVKIYKKVLDLRPEEPQSYRDLALAYERAGRIKESFDLLYKLYNGELLEKDEDGRYEGIEELAFVELTRLINKHEKELKLHKDQKEKFKEVQVDVRVVIDWNHNDTDIDLWVIDPSGEKAYYGNSETKIGGRISMDMTEGYGPEEFMVKNAIKGEYKVMVDYFSDDLQKISGPTILKVTFFTNYGKKNEKKEITIVRLDKEEDELEVGTLMF